MQFKSVAGAILIAVIASNTQAAVLKNISGMVMLNTGDGFRKVSGITGVNQGDRVLVRGKGGAQIDYGNGCVVQITANQSVVVLSSQDCEKAPVHSASTNSSGSLKDSPALYAAEEAPDHQLYVVGGVLLAAGAAVTALQAGHDGPASP